MVGKTIQNNVENSPNLWFPGYILNIHQYSMNIEDLYEYFTILHEYIPKECTILWAIRFVTTAGPAWVPPAVASDCLSAYSWSFGLLGRMIVL